MKSMTAAYPKLSLYGVTSILSPYSVPRLRYYTNVKRIHPVNVLGKVTEPPLFFPSVATTMNILGQTHDNRLTPPSSQGYEKIMILPGVKCTFSYYNCEFSG